MSQLKRYYGENDLHFLTTSTYRRARLFDSERFKRRRLQTLEPRGDDIYEGDGGTSVFSG